MKPDKLNVSSMGQFGCQMDQLLSPFTDPLMLVIFYYYIVWLQITNSTYHANRELCSVL